ncbi:MAG: diadenylate cyclase [Gemmataceae bacterium]|nr:diadenylate cyclase [Gemmataceae bacterium]MDW8264705.1 diadenylate cyclase [Gemmataceae bacterium]
MTDRLTQLVDSIGVRDLIEIAVLAVGIYAIVRFLGKTRGSGMVRGLALIIVGLFLATQVIIAWLDLTELGKIFDYLLTTVVVALLVIFQPELRRGLMLLGRYRMLRYFVGDSYPLADKLADAAEALSRECVGALIAIQREVGLEPYVETGERIDAEVSAALIRTIFSPRSPLHDGALVLCNGRLTAAACQLPLGQPPDRTKSHIGMRHRAALALSEETDAVLLVVSEETGRISIAVAGKLTPVPRENLSRCLAELLSHPTALERPVRKAA